MYRMILRALATSASIGALGAASLTSTAAQPMSLAPGSYVSRAAGTPRAEPEQPRVYAASQTTMGGGFIEFLFGGGVNSGYGPEPYQQPANGGDPRYQQGMPAEQQRMFDPRYNKQVVTYSGHETPGTIVIDTRDKFLYLVQDGGQAVRYGVGVGRPGFVWAGTKVITQKREWPDWTPPPEMLVRRPDLPRHMDGGPENPLGARAMYLGSSLYRIHGSNEPWTIGTNVSSGCIRMRNEDVIDLYGRVRVGTKVVVI